MARSVDPANRYRLAWQAGRDGRRLPSGLADLADSDPKIDAAFDHGQGGHEWDSFADEHGLTSPDAPAELSHQSTGGAVASGVFGLIAAALVISIIDYGANGPIKWFEAKFLNKTGEKASNKTTASTVSSTTPVVPGPAVIA